MTMTREDVLNELELLPVWRLREALKVDASQMLATLNVNTLEAITNVTLENTPSLATQVMDDSVYENPLSIHDEQASSATPATIIAKIAPLQSLVDYFEVGDYVFIVAHTPRSAEVNTLFSNMLRAMRLSLPAAQTMDIKNIPQHSPKVTVAMGEIVSRMLFDAQLIFEDLRGQVHTVAGQRVVVSYDAEHLLAHPQHKPKAWADLCLAMQAEAQRTQNS